VRARRSGAAEAGTACASRPSSLFSRWRSAARGLLQPTEPRKGRVLGAGAGVETDETRGLDNQGVLDMQVQKMKRACVR